MLQDLQIDNYQKEIRQQLEDIRHNLKFLEKVAIDLSALSGRRKDAERDVLIEKGEGLRVELKDKLKNMEVNVGEVVAMLDWKVGLIVKQLAKVEKHIKATIAQPLVTPSPTISSKEEQQYKQLITTLEEQIFEFQKRENENVKEISQLKEKNAKLREEFTNLSFDSNQRIKELSEKLHNNTSPNLGIKKISNNNKYDTPTKFETSYFVTSEELERKNIMGGNNNFVKIKGGNLGTNSNVNILNEMSSNNVKIKTKKNLLDSFTSESSDFDIKPYGEDGVGYEQSSSNRLMLGCFPGKQISEKTKTGSSSENKKLKFEENCEKSRRFEFLLNNLIDDTSEKDETAMENVFSTNEHQGQSTSDGNGRFFGNYQQKNNGGYQQSYNTKSPIENSYQKETSSRGIFNNNEPTVKRYQI